MFGQKVGCGGLSQASDVFHARLHQSAANLGVGLWAGRSVENIIVYFQ